MFEASGIRRMMFGAWILLTALGAAGAADAHMATERYIPIGQSPGVSHKLTAVGKIESVDPVRRSIRFSTPSGSLVVEVGKDAKIWVDRTKLRQTNLDGVFENLKIGATVEVKFVDPARKRVAEWVKVEASP